jgi:hypothetical protein
MRSIIRIARSAIRPRSARSRSAPRKRCGSGSPGIRRGSASSRTSRCRRRGEPSREVTAVVTRHGKVVAGAEVRLGHATGAARELLALDTRVSDAGGRCVFPLAAVTELAIVATTPTAGSKIVDVASGRDFVEVPLLEFGALEGRVTKQGVPVAGSVSITGRDGGVHRVRRGDATGAYRIDAVVPGEYDVCVEGIDPSNHMTAGTPTFDRIVVPEGRLVRRDFVLVAGTRLEVVLRVEHDRHNGSVYLIAGEVAAEAAQTSVDLHALVKRLDRTAWRSANSSTNTGTHMTTQFLDVQPGVYTLCVYPGDYEPGRHREQPVIRERIVLGAEPARVELVLPPVRRSVPAAPPAAASPRPAPHTPSKPPPMPPKRKP